MPKGMFSCRIDYDERVEECPEYHFAPECCKGSFGFTLVNKALEITIPRRYNGTSHEIAPLHLVVKTTVPITLTDTKAVHEALIRWKVLFRGWYNVLAYMETQTVIIKPDNCLWRRSRLPNNRFSRSDYQITSIEPKPYNPRQWHIWPTKPVSRRMLEKTIELSSTFEQVPIHYELLARAINSFNDEYFDLAAMYSAMALERAVYEIVTTLPRTKEEFAEDLDRLIGDGHLERRDRRNYINMFAELQHDKLPLGGLLKLLPAIPFDKPIGEIKKLSAELLKNVNDLRISVLHHGRPTKRDSAHESVVTTMKLIYGSLAP